MMRADRSSVAGSRYLDLQRKARQTGRPTDELIQLYALECFLDRLTRSAFAQKFVLKGGVLLAALDARRPTRDIDFAASAIRATETEILAAVREIARIPLDDGMEFSAEQATAEIIREEADYNGVRITLSGTLSRAEIRARLRGSLFTGGAAFSRRSHSPLLTGPSGAISTARPRTIDLRPCWIFRCRANALGCMAEKATAGN